LAVVPGLAVFLHGALRTGVSRRSAALLLDRSAATKERFTAAEEAEDPEVRELAARQALAASSLSGGKFPLRFPPSPEGLAAALGVFLLVGAILLVADRETGEPPAERRAAFPGESGTGTGDRDGAGSTDAGGPVAEAGTDPRVPERVERALIEERDLSEEDWRELEARGVVKRVREEVRDALAAGDGEAALEALRSALRGAAGTGEPESATIAPPRWPDYASAKVTPTWSPRFDGVVRRYFERIRTAEGR
jgi:hypothetical protein